MFKLDSEVREAIKAFMRRERINQKEIAASVGMKPEDVSRLLNGSAGVGPEKGQLLCDYCGVTFKEHRNEVAVRYRQLPYYERPVIKMNTSFLLEKLNIPTEWIPQYGEVGLVKMSGDSMNPTIQNKDVVAIDFTDQFQTNGVYAVMIDGTVGLARLQKKFDSIRITYDNDRYEELDTANAPPGTFQIVGKAVAGWVAF